jgi:hypothetical protein
MRKADYTTLAKYIKDGIVCNPGETGLIKLAYLLANALHVDKAAFLRACGLSS